MYCLFKMSASKIQRRPGLKSWDTENMIQTIKALCNKEMGYLAAAKKCNLPRSTLYDYVRPNWDTFQVDQVRNGGVTQIFFQLLKRSLLNISYYLSGNISDSLETMLEG